MRNTLSVGVFFSCIESLSHRYNPYKSADTPLLNRTIDVSISSVSKLLSLLLSNPLYMIKTRIESHIDSNNTMHNIRDIYSKYGYRGFYKGIYATIMRDIPYTSIQFSIYKILGDICNVFNNDSVYNNMYIFMLGGLSSVLSCIITQPFDIARVGKCNR